MGSGGWGVIPDPLLEHLCFLTYSPFSVYVESSICILQDEAYTAYVGNAVPKDSEFLELMNYMMIEMFQTGMLENLHKKYLDFGLPDSTCHCLEKFQGENLVLGYENLTFLFGILVAGTFAALAGAVFERSTQRAIFTI